MAHLGDAAAAIRIGKWILEQYQPAGAEPGGRAVSWRDGFLNYTCIFRIKSAGRIARLRRAKPQELILPRERIVRLVRVEARLEEIDLEPSPVHVGWFSPEISPIIEGAERDNRLRTGQVLTLFVQVPMADLRGHVQVERLPLESGDRQTTLVVTNNLDFSVHGYLVPPPLVPFPYASMRIMRGAQALGDRVLELRNTRTLQLDVGDLSAQLPGVDLTTTGAWAGSAEFPIHEKDEIRLALDLEPRDHLKIVIRHQ